MANWLCTELNWPPGEPGLYIAASIDKDFPVDLKYTLGIAELDSQHSEIEALFTALQESISDRKRWSALLDSVCEKMRFHFYAEESIMRIFAYPELQEHTRKHGEVLQSVERYKGKRLTKADIEQLNEQPMQLFFEQILSQDLRFAAFIKRNKERLGIV